MKIIIGFVLVVAMLGAAWFARLQYAFPIVLALMLVFCVFIGIAICHEPMGILINEQNVMSLARFQITLWTIIIISALLVIAFARIKNGVVADEDGLALADPLHITLGENLLALLGISAVSFVGSPLIAATKRSKTADPKAAETTAKEMVRQNNVPDSVKATAPVNKVPANGAPPPAGATPPPKNAPPPPEVTAHVENEIGQNAEGILFKNPRISDASFADLFEGNELGNAAHVDLAKVQMFFFTVVVAIAYLNALWDLIHTGAIYGADFAFPALSNGMVGLLGISNAGYLAAKGVDHTPKTTT